MIVKYYLPSILQTPNRPFFFSNAHEVYLNQPNDGSKETHGVSLQEFLLSKNKNFES
jgi:hypothetical protein